MTFGEIWALWWFGCFFGFGFFDIVTNIIPPPPNTLVCFFIGALVGVIGFGPLLLENG